MKTKTLVIFMLTILVLGSCTSVKPYERQDLFKISQQGLELDCRDKTITPFIIHYVLDGMIQLQEGEFLDLILNNNEYVIQDILAWVDYCSITLVSQQKAPKSYKIRFQKQTLENKGKTFALVLGQNGLGEILSPLGFALGAAVSGFDVYIYLNGPAVRIVEEGYKEKLKGFNFIFSGLARKELNKAGHVPPLQKLLLLEKYGAQIYICGPSAETFKLNRDKIGIKNITYAEYMSFIPILEKADIELFY